LNYPVLLHLRRHAERMSVTEKEEDVDMVADPEQKIVSVEERRRGAQAPEGKDEKKRGAFHHLTWPADKPIWTHQRSALQSMREQQAAGRRGFPIFLSVGLGKTSLPLAHVAEQEEVENMIYVVNIESFDNIITQMKAFGQPADKIFILIPTQDVADKIRKTASFRPHLWSWKDHRDEHGQIQLPHGRGNMLLCTHDHIKHVAMGSLDAIVSRSAVVFDEAHLAMAPTQRTHAALSLCSRAHVYAFMSGTPTLDSSLTGMAEWFALMSDFPVTRQNVWLSMAAAIFSDVKRDSQIETRPIEAEFADEAERKLYQSLVPIACGGTDNRRKTAQEIAAAFAICQARCRRTVVDQAIAFTRESKTGGALVLFDNSKDRDEYLGYFAAAQISRSAIFVIGVDGASLELTDTTVRNGGTDYRFVLASISSALGCQWSRLKAVFSSVIMANQSKRTQSGARVARPGQTAKIVPYVVVHLGLLSMIMRAKHASAASVEQWVLRFASAASQ
jgi:hypothetical protein